MYDPTIGRWISQDPIGFAAEDANLYRYVDNSPVLSVDPTGLKAYVGHVTVEYSKAFSGRLKAKFEITVDTGATGEQTLSVRVRARRDFGSHPGGENGYRLEWNRMCMTPPSFEYRGLVWSGTADRPNEPGNWAMPNVALFFDGTDEENHYGGSHVIVPPTIDPQTGEVKDPGKEAPDNDYMEVRVKTFERGSGTEYDSGSTKAWKPVPNGHRGEHEVVHKAMSDRVFVKRPMCGTVIVELQYMDERWGGPYGNVTVSYDFSDNGSGLVQPRSGGQD